ncbi:MAG: response regulator [Ferruginibacter sp.]
MKNFKKVIVADDDNDDLLLFQEALKETCPDTELESVTNGQQLLALLNTTSLPEAVFIDLNIPGKNGRECLYEIRHKEEYNEMLVIVLSGSHSQAEINYCLETGADYFFIKPSSFGELKNIVAEVCTGKLLASK